MRFHTSLPARDIEETVSFYRALLGAPPAKQKPDYAKFVTDDPGLNISFHLAPDAVDSLRELHLGFELADREALDRFHARMRAAGLISAPRATSTCCYARQDKFWITDPNGYAWELYYRIEDTAEKSDRRLACC